MTGTPSDLGQLEPVYTVAEVAAVLRLSTDTVYRRIESGIIEAFRVGKGIRVKKSILDAYLAEIGYATVSIAIADPQGAAQ